jgi:outer membrane receptor for ferrienterochelin and colicin
MIMKFAKSITIVALAIFGAFLSTSEIAMAQSRGKVAGVVTDAQTGEALLGVNVILKGTQLGSATDMEGRYAIIGVPPGTYELRASYLGYQAVTIQNVQVKTNLTAKHDIELSSEEIVTEEVVVVAKRKLVQRDVTSTRRTVTREDMNLLPGIESTSDIFRMQGGVYEGGVSADVFGGQGQNVAVRDSDVKDIHVRGGRGGEILFLVDGVPVTNPISGGHEALNMNVIAVEQIEMVAGAFSAQFGKAQSGVVNITTRSGGEDYHGGLEFRTDQLGLFGENYNFSQGALFLSGPEPITRQLLPLLGVNVPGNAGFFFSMNATQEDGREDNGRVRQKIDLFGVELNEKQNNDQSINANLSYEPAKAVRMKFSLNTTLKDWTFFSWPYRYIPDNMRRESRDNINYNVMFNHVLSQNTYYALNFGYLNMKFNRSNDGRTPDDYWMFSRDLTGEIDTVYSTVEPTAADPVWLFILDPNMSETFYSEQDAKAYTGKFDFTSQFHPEHMLKVGAELQYSDLLYYQNDNGGTELSRYGRYLYRGGEEADKPLGPHPEFGTSRWYFNTAAAEGSFYVEETFEKEFIVLNAGVRADFFWLGDQVTKDYWKTRWENVTKLDADWDDYLYAISPRFGVSFPILEETVIFFSYGHFSQLPGKENFFKDPYSGSNIGNPRLDYEQTILYEFGFTHQIVEDWVIDVKSYAKDISDQLGTISLSFGGGGTSETGATVTMPDNISYGRARGIEAMLTKGYSDFTTGKITYTLQWADGYSSSTYEDAIRQTENPDQPSPIRETRLGWDVRHQLIVNFTLTSPEGRPIDLFGFELPDDWVITVLFRAMSGEAYTPYVPRSTFAEEQRLRNTATGPNRFYTDLKVSKGFSMFGTKLSIILDIFNLFDAVNAYTGSGFNNYTGKPWVYGDVDHGNVEYIRPYQKVFYEMTPYVYSPPRYAKIGIKWEF